MNEMMAIMITEMDEAPLEQLSQVGDELKEAQHIDIKLLGLLS